MPARALSVGVVVLGAVYFYLALLLPLQTLNGPGAGFFPLLIGALLMLTGISVAVRTSKLTAFRNVEPAARRKVLIILASLVGFCFLLPRLGYVLSGILVMVSVLRQFEASWKLTALVSLISAVATYYLFVALLGLQLPRGDWLPA